MPRVLIVDDEPAILQLFSYIFEDAGYEVFTARNGREALGALARTGRVNLIILDIAMPEMDGREFIVSLNRMAATENGLAGIPFIVMTGENFMDWGNKVFTASPGFICFFPKMTPPEKVMDRARAALEGGA